jgi:peptidoglycan/xylan/chitin deacetylase (PgdA/CDA1 family)
MISKSIPVIMYHNIGIVNQNWLWSHLTCPWELFQDHLVWMKKFKIETISIQQLYDYKRNNIKLPDRSIVLTFDDGYLDNWVFAYPLLKKYGFKGTIFVNPEFVDKRNLVRKNLEDVWHKGVPIDELEKDGFLSWSEIKIMDSEGVVDIQSHSMSHTWYFCSDEIIDFHSPGNNKYPWLLWNMKPERKSYYISENQEHFMPYGMPIYSHGRSLGIRRYYEDQNLGRYLADYVKDQGINLFRGNDWKSKLYRQADTYKRTHTLRDRFETDEEVKDRYTYELKRSKEILEKKLDKPIHFLCWPGGAKNETSIRICFDAGYIAYTLSSLKGGGTNIYPEEPSRIYRIGAPSIQRNRQIYYMGGLAFVIRYLSFKMNMLGRIVQKLVRTFMGLLIALRIKKNGIIMRG